METRDAALGLRLANNLKPRVLVWDADTTGRNGKSIEREVESYQGATLILGTLRQTSGELNLQVMPKPYHYGPLVRKIEELLQLSDRRHAG